MAPPLLCLQPRRLDQQQLQDMAVRCPDPPVMGRDEAAASWNNFLNTSSPAPWLLPPGLEATPQPSSYTTFEKPNREAQNWYNVYNWIRSQSVEDASSRSSSSKSLPWDDDMPNNSSGPSFTWETSLKAHQQSRVDAPHTDIAEEMLKLNMGENRNYYTSNVSYGGLSSLSPTSSHTPANHLYFDEGIKSAFINSLPPNQKCCNHSNAAVRPLAAHNSLDTTPVMQNDFMSQECSEWFQPPVSKQQQLLQQQQQHFYQLMQQQQQQQQGQNSAWNSLTRGEILRRNNTAIEVHKRLEECSEEYKLFEKERKQTEAELARHNLGKKISSSNGMPIPRLPTSPSRVDRLIVDFHREHARIITLLDKMENLKGKPLPASVHAALSHLHHYILILQNCRQTERNTIFAAIRGEFVQFDEEKESRALIQALNAVRKATMRARAANWYSLITTLGPIDINEKQLLDRILASDFNVASPPIRVRPVKN